MSDNQTLRDYIEDLMAERNELLRTIRELEATLLAPQEIRGCYLRGVGCGTNVLTVAETLTHP